VENSLCSRAISYFHKSNSHQERCSMNVARLSRNTVAAFALLGCLISPEFAWSADCQVGLSQRLDPCTRCTYVWKVTTKHDTTCIVSGTSSAGGSGQGAFTGAGTDVVRLGGKLVKKPQHGTATVQGVGTTYTPAKGYVGKDSFTVERDMLENNKA